jgi:hypothetical protein
MKSRAFARKRMREETGDAIELQAYIASEPELIGAAERKEAAP